MLPIIRLALADDHLLMRKGLIMLLEDFQHLEVITDAGNGKELLDNIAALPQPPDICLLDVKMPKLNGFETLLELKKTMPQVKVLMLSVYDNELSIMKFLRNGADGYLVKGCDITELYNAIMHVYEGGIFLPSELISKKKDGRDVATLPVLSTKEYLFLSYCSTELSYKEIAEKMNQSIRTIEGYRDQLLKKLNLRSRIGLATFAVETGISVVYKT